MTARSRFLRRFGLESTAHVSLALYNTHAEIDTLAAAVRRIAANRVVTSRRGSMAR
jgi:selenocysteine lyase/cysteine desulfurase